MNKYLPYALITAGGTSVKIDGVRSITNEAKGGFGVALATALVERGVQVILLCTEATQDKYEIPREVHVETFKFFEEYMERLRYIVEEFGQPSWAFSSAAVSDFAPSFVFDGKIQSGDAIDPITFVPLPKILNTWRERFGRSCYLVGYKLLDHDKNLEELIDAARKQNTRAHLNLTVANFKPWGQSNSGRFRKIHLVKPHGGFITIEGTLSHVATELVEFVLSQSQATWSSSHRVGDRDEITQTQPTIMDGVDQLLATTHEAALLRGSPGNVALYQRELNSLVVTPRAFARKEQLQPDQLIVAKRRGTRQIDFWSNDSAAKPSIDTNVYLRVFARAASLKAAIHFHDGWVLGAQQTRADFPCGCDQEAELILEALAHATIKEKSTLPWSMIELVNHGHILFLHDHPLAMSFLRERVLRAKHAYSSHLSDINQFERIKELSISPLFNRVGVPIGIVAQHRREGWCSFFISPAFRAEGYGEALIDLIDQRRMSVGVHNDCNVERFYRSRGFTVQSRREDGLVILLPPSVGGHGKAAATMTIRAASTGRYLHILRGAGAFKNFWSHPGGKVDGFETPWQTAVREAKEEVGFDAHALLEPTATSLCHTVDLAEDTKYDRRFFVKTFHVDVPEEFEPFVDGHEVTEAGWFHPDAMDHPMGHGTRRAMKSHELFLSS